MDGGLEGGGVAGGGAGGWDGGIGTPADEESGDVEMAIVERIVEGSPPSVVLFVDKCISTVGEEDVDDIQMAIEGRIVEGSPPSVVVDRCISTVGEEDVDDIQIALEGCKVEGSRPNVVLSIHVCSSLQQLGDACNIPPTTRNMQRIPRHSLQPHNPSHQVPCESLS